MKSALKFYFPCLVLSPLFGVLGAIMRVMHWSNAQYLLIPSIMAFVAYTCLALLHLWQDSQTKTSVKVSWTIGLVFTAGFNWFIGLIYYFEKIKAVSAPIILGQKS
jgi:hypothetical protein